MKFSDRTYFLKPHWYIEYTITWLSAKCSKLSFKGSIYSWCITNQQSLEHHGAAFETEFRIITDSWIRHTAGHWAGCAIQLLFATVASSQSRPMTLATHRIPSGSNTESAYSISHHAVITHVIALPLRSALQCTTCVAPTTRVDHPCCITCHFDVYVGGLVTDGRPHVDLAVITVNSNYTRLVDRLMGQFTGCDEHRSWADYWIK